MHVFETADVFGVIPTVPKGRKALRCLSFGTIDRHQVFGRDSESAVSRCARQQRHALPNARIWEASMLVAELRG